MTTNESSSTEWEQSPPGSMVGFARRERIRETRRKLTVAVSAVSLISAVGWGGFALFGPRAMREPNFGGVTCSTVRQHAMDVMAGKTPDALTEKIRLHLEQCRECKSYWDEMSTRRMQQSSWLPGASHGGCDCDACRVRLADDPRVSRPLALALARDPG